MPPTNYTGNPTATQAPGPQPALGAVTVSSLPVDGDPLNASSVAQALKEPADFATFLAGRSLLSLWGTGADGDATITSSTSITSDLNYNNLTIGATGILVTNNFVVRVKGTLTIVSGGKIVDRLASAKNGADAPSTTAGVGGTGTNSLSTGSTLGGADGGAGGAVSVAGSSGLNVTSSLGGLGGVGGDGNTGAAGGPAGSRAALVGTTASSLRSALAQPGWIIARGGDGTARTGSVVGIQGGSGGGGGGGSPSVHPGAGGGAGGGVVIAIAQHVVLATSTDLMAPGGNGGAANTGPFASGGGGGGGGGGAVLLYYGSKSGPALNAATAVPGGTGGAADNAGAAGAAGNVFEFNVGY